MQISKISYTKYLFSDKQATLFWIMIFIGLSIMTGLNYIVKIEYYDQYFRMIILFSMIFLTIFIYIGFYTSGFINLKIQNRFKLDYEQDILYCKLVDVELYQDSFTIKPLRQNYDARIKIKPRKDKFELIKIDDSIYLLGQVYEMGLFRHHLKPMFINMSSEINTMRKNVLKPKIWDLSIQNNDLIIKFEKSIKGINTMIIKDYEKQPASNNGL